MFKKVQVQNSVFYARTFGKRSSSAAEGHPAGHAIDGDSATRWAAEGEDEWLQLRLDPSVATGRIGRDWHKAGQRQAKFTIETSSDGKVWTPVRNLRRELGASEDTPVAVDVFKEAGGSNRLWAYEVPVAVQRPGSVRVMLTPVKGPVTVCGMSLAPLGN